MFKSIINTRVPLCHSAQAPGATLLKALRCDATSDKPHTDPHQEIWSESSWVYLLLNVKLKEN